MVRNFMIVFMIALSCGIAGGAVAQEPQLVDPMRPLNLASEEVRQTQKAVAKGSLHLTGVLISEQRSVAVINGKSLQKGDRIHGYQLVRIKADRVELRGKAGKRTLHRTGTGLKKISTKSDVKKGSKL